KEPTDDNLRYPEVGRFELSPLNGAHTTFPVLGMPIAEFAKDKIGKIRNFVVVTDEQIANECQEARQFVWFVDVTVEKHPISVATWGARESPGDFCSRGGRFGTHASNETMTPIYYKRVMFFSHFNAGVRAVDIRDPYRPTEVGYYIRSSPRTPTSAASSSTMASSAAKWRSRPTTSKSTTAATSILSIAPTPD